MAKDGTTKRGASAARTESSFFDGSARMTEPLTLAYAPLSRVEEDDDLQESLEENPDEPDPPLRPSPKNPHNRQELMN
ncbi:hypothetical protein GJ744_006170 [Endocarpon pusillum]|uniref:Uncharacterized protein n=1 Tax=Endocarpon pusillum TaxID=364733 RepID=A0A8H7DWT9_9EURO|nr:hypothetical protein GJ744_006170 [Endocarpon pusillum]